MKQTFTILSLCFVVWLVSSCAPKERFMFSNLPVGQGVKQKARPAGDVMPPANATSTENSTQDIRSKPDSVFLTASTAPLALSKAALFPNNVLSANAKANTVSKSPVSKLVLSPVKMLKLQKSLPKQLKLLPDDGSKIKNKLTKAGFYLSLGGLALLLLLGGTVPGVAILAFLASIAGLITSIIGLIQITKNPNKYVGKNKAIIGIIFSAGLFLLSIFILYILAFGGAFV